MSRTKVMYFLRCEDTLLGDKTFSTECPTELEMMVRSAFYNGAVSVKVAAIEPMTELLNHTDLQRFMESVSTKIERQT